jgi:hypothetical protein
LSCVRASWIVDGATSPLTSKGKAKYREALRLWQVAQDRFEHVFGRSEAAALRATLLGIAHHERLAALRD